MRGIAPLLILQYPESRLYDTINAKHLSLDELRQWWNRGISFEVHDSQTGEDVTRGLFEKTTRT
jgi:polyhydroxyalkanoate synthesis regulator protein